MPVPVVVVLVFVAFVLGYGLALWDTRLRNIGQGGVGHGENGFGDSDDPA